MKMTEDGIFSVIAQEDVVDIELSIPALTRLFVRELAVISPKINRDELAAMLIVGAALYQKGAREFRDGIDEKVLFEALQKRRDGEGGR